MKEHIRPLMSYMIIISSLLIIVFSKTEVRRLGYNVFRLTNIERQAREDLRHQQMRFAQLTRPERIELLAQTKLELREPQRGQIIQLVAGRLALKH